MCTVCVRHKLTSFSSTRSLVQKLVMPAFEQGKLFVCTVFAYTVYKHRNQKPIVYITHTSSSYELYVSLILSDFICLIKLHSADIGLLEQLKYFYFRIPLIIFSNIKSVIMAYVTISLQNVLQSKIEANVPTKYS